jgi:hypothetical protein
MPLVQLSDVIEPEVYADYQAENSPEKSRLVESGLLTTGEALNAKANTGGKVLDVPYWHDLDANDEPNLSDDTEDNAVPSKVDADEYLARISYLNNGWKDADLVTEVAGSNPMQRIAARTGVYWTRQLQRRLIASARGIQAANVANNSGDMINDIALEAGNSATAANRYSREAFIDAVFTLGDNFDALTALGVHSLIYRQMVKNDDIDFVKDSTGTFDIPTFMGKEVIVDDNCPVTAGATNGFKITSILYGADAFGLGVGTPRKPVAVERKESEGQGGGTETLWERKTWLLHPSGHSFLSNTVTGASPSLAELALAANWERKMQRKNTPIAFLVTNQ